MSPPTEMDYYPIQLTGWRKLWAIIRRREWLIHYHMTGVRFEPTTSEDADTVAYQVTYETIERVR